MLFSVLLVTIYWFSYLIVGLATWFFLIKKLQNKYSYDSMLVIFISFCLGFGTAAPLVLAGYLLTLPLAATVFMWLLIVLVSLHALTAEFRSNTINVIRGIFSEKITLFMVLVVAVDFIVSLWVGGFINLGTDSWMHIARANDILENGYTIRDPYFPQLIDSRYHISLLHPLYAMSAVIGKTSALLAWTYSLAFFRLLATLGVYVVAKLIANDRAVAAVSSSVALIGLSYEWRFVQYPNKIVHIWLVFLVVSLISLMIRSKDRLPRVLLLMSTLLVSLTHAPFSLGVAGFMITTIIVDLISRRNLRNLEAYQWIAISTIPLILVSVISGLLPTQRTLYEVETNIVSFAGFYALDPLLGANILIITSSLLLISLTYLLIKKTTEGAVTRIVLLSSSLFFILIAFTPPIFTILNEYLPTQLIKRYRETNVLIPIILSNVTVILVLHWLTKKVRIRWPATYIVFVTGLLLMAFSVENAKKYAGDQIRNKDKTFSKVHSLEDALGGEDFNKKYVVAGEEISYHLPALVNSKSVSVYQYHSAPTSNYEVRNRCLEELLSNNDEIRMIALTTIRPEYYLIDKNLEYLAHKSEMEFIRLSNDQEYYALYRVDYSKVRGEHITSDACTAVVNGTA